MVLIGAECPPPWRQPTQLALSCQPLGAIPDSVALQGSGQAPMAPGWCFTRMSGAHSSGPRLSAVLGPEQGILKTGHCVSVVTEEQGSLPGSLSFKKKKRPLSRFLKVMTKLKQLVTKQTDRSLARGISVSVFGEWPGWGGWVGSILEAGFGLSCLVLLPSGPRSDVPFPPRLR